MRQKEVCYFNWKEKSVILINILLARLPIHSIHLKGVFVQVWYFKEIFCWLLNICWWNDENWALGYENLWFKCFIWSSSISYLGQKALWNFIFTCLLIEKDRIRCTIGGILFNWIIFVFYRFVGRFMSRRERLEVLGDKMRKFNNVYVKNFSEEIDDEKLRDMFEPYGKIISAKV